MKHEKKAVRIERDALAHAADGVNRPADDGPHGGIRRAHEERVRHTHVGDTLTDQARPECVQIQLDIGKLGHYPGF
jgi:hypothetical protein